MCDDAISLEREREGSSFCTVCFQFSMAWSSQDSRTQSKSVVDHPSVKEYICHPMLNLVWGKSVMYTRPFVQGSYALDLLINYFIIYFFSTVIRIVIG